MLQMAALNKNYTHNVFNPADKEQRRLWYEILKDIPDGVFAEAVLKIMCNEVFAPNIAKLRNYCAEVAAPIQTDDTEAWGLVVVAIRHYGYYRAEEALKSLPKPVREAVTRVGGIKMICESENSDVIRGQFNKAMTAVNNRDRVARNTSVGLMNALNQISCSTEPLKIEYEKWERSDKETNNNGIETIEEVLKNLGLRKGNLG